MHPMLPLMVPALLVSTFLVMAFLWYCQEGKKSEDREEHIYVIRGTRQQRELLKRAAEKKNVSGKKSSKALPKTRAGYGQVQSATTDTEGSGHKPPTEASVCYVRIAQQQKLFTA